jgi:hypothetical protein
MVRRGVITGLAALCALLAAAAGGARQDAAPALYMFKVSVHAVVSYDGTLQEPWYVPVTRSTYGCAPVVAASATLTANRPASRGSRPDFIFVRGRLPHVVFAGDRQSEAPANETVRATNTLGPPDNPNTGCSPSQPPSDCGTAARPVDKTAGAVFLGYSTRRGPSFSVYAAIGLTARPPFHACYVYPQLEGDSELKGAAATEVFRRLSNPRLSRVKITGTTRADTGTDPAGTFHWTATFVRIRRCPYPIHTHVEDACRRGLR